MEYVTLSNGIKMPILGYGVYQVTKDECERCVLDVYNADVERKKVITFYMFFCKETVDHR